MADSKVKKKIYKALREGYFSDPGRCWSVQLHVCAKARGLSWSPQHESLSVPSTP
jgi:hypothetical protein